MPNGLEPAGFLIKLRPDRAGGRDDFAANERRAVILRRVETDSRGDALRRKLKEPLSGALKAALPNWEIPRSHQATFSAPLAGDEVGLVKAFLRTRPDAATLRENP